MRRDIVSSTITILIGVVLGSGPTVIRGESLVAESIPAGRFSFGGLVAPRVSANLDQWLLEAPDANPGMLEMFRVRDRKPVPNLVPWAGEFVGKYLISTIQALRMTSDDRLRPYVEGVIDELLSTQADDGYLGPFRHEERLLGYWDLWGHYHVMTALLMWHEMTGDERSLSACRKAADLVCQTYLNSNRRVVDAGSPEMNMAIITSLGWLYRITNEPRYLEMAKEVLVDFEMAGDYFRTGLDGVDFYRTPRPRWESLHCIQGLVELYRITGDERYKTAFMNLWTSIRDWDLRNTGGFSSGEQATGNPYEDSAIETCCSIAWMALSIDALRLTCDPAVADVIDLGFWNAILGAQHPTGRWWTYNTPMNGAREASAHSIVFQSRAGTPELNCCSVNAPRGLGMLTEWAVMTSSDAININYLAPMTATLPAPGGGTATIIVEGDYPLNGNVRVRLQLDKPRTFQLAIRIPGFAESATVQLGQQAADRAKPGYWRESRSWSGDDEIQIKFDMPIRPVVGDLEQAGKVSLYRGPILLAYDQSLNPFDEEDIPVLDATRLGDAKVSFDTASTRAKSLEHWLNVSLPAGDQTITLCDFATAGARGTRYRSWLAATSLDPPKPRLLTPPNDARIPPGRFPFTYRPMPTHGTDQRSLLFEIVDFEHPDRIIHRAKAATAGRFILPTEWADSLKPATTYTWRLTSIEDGRTSVSESRRFTVDSSLAPIKPDELTEFGEREDGLLLADDLTGNAEPIYGKLLKAESIAPASGPGDQPASAVALAGPSSHLIYQLRQFPTENYSLSLWVHLPKHPDHLGQVASAWCRGGDDPLRVCIDGGQIFARIEGTGAHSTAGQPMPLNQWVHVAAVKSGPSLTLYLDGKSVSQASVPKHLISTSQALALGRNPLYSGDESLPARFARFRFFAKALTNEDIHSLASKDAPRP